MSVIPGKDTIRVPLGGSETVHWTFTVDGSPMDWTDYSLYLQVRKFKAQSSVLLASLTNTDESGSLTTNSETGEVVAHFSEVLVGDLEAGKYHFDLLAIPAGGDPEYYIEGPFIVFDTVTKKPE